MSNTLLDGGSIVELISRSLIDKINPQPLIFRDKDLHVSLANDNLIILTKYIEIRGNLEGVEAIIKA